MEMMDYVKFLGMYWGEPALQPLIEQLKSSKPPKISKGDVTGHLEFKKIGIYLVFRDERFVKIPGKSFPEGAIVLSNISFYLIKKDGYQSYTGNLPGGIESGATKTEVIKVFGFPNDPKYSTTGELLPDEEDWMMRWDHLNHVMFCSFNDDDQAISIGLQLPLDQV
jgi:hypothetical protein